MYWLDLLSVLHVFDYKQRKAISKIILVRLLIEISTLLSHHVKRTMYYKLKLDNVMIHVKKVK